MTEVAQYVGVAATMQPKEIEQLSRMLDMLCWPAGVRFMNGPLVSRKTLAGKPPPDPAQYPPFETVSSLLSQDPRFFNVVHFNSRDPRLEQQLTKIASLSSHLHAIQLNILWPNPAELDRFRRNHPDIQLILQLSRDTLSSVGGCNEALIEGLQPYKDMVEYLLFDPSGGEGKAYQHSVAARLLEDLQSSSLSMQLGVTGGLCADRCWQLQSLLELYPSLCWDAQSALRDKQAGNVLDMSRCYGFLAASRGLLG